MTFSILNETCLNIVIFLIIVKNNCPFKTVFMLCSLDD